MIDTSRATARARRPTGIYPDAAKEEFRKRMGIGQPMTEELRQRQAAELRKMGQEFIARDYARYGLEPVYADEKRTTLVSLHMLMKMGWKIKVVGPNQFELEQPGKK